jgi:hypothetical protein
MRLEKMTTIRGAIRLTDHDVRIQLGAAMFPVSTQRLRLEP